MLEPLAFQFGGAQLLPEGVTLSADLTLEPGEALLIASQIFAYRGQRDGVRVRAAGDSGQGEGHLEIRTGATQTAFTFPLRGRWYNGAGASFHSHHRWTPIEEFAYDLARLNRDQRTHRGNGARFSDYLAYGEPIYAAAPGRVISVINDEPEDANAMQQPGETLEAYFTRLQQEQFARLARGARGIGGNQIVIDHGNNEFSFYGHLRTGSAQNQGRRHRHTRPGNRRRGLFGQLHRAPPALPRLRRPRPDVLRGHPGSVGGTDLRHARPPARTTDRRHTGAARGLSRFDRDQGKRRPEPPPFPAFWEA